MGVLGVALVPEADQPVVCELQHEAAVHHAVGGFQVAMGDDHTVMEECHSLRGEETISLFAQNAANLKSSTVMIIL